MSKLTSINPSIGKELGIIETTPLSEIKKIVQKSHKVVATEK